MKCPDIRSGIKSGMALFPHNCMDRDFTDRSETLSDVAGLASAISQSARDLSCQVVCLASDRKTLVAASILSAMSGGPKVIIPHALSRRVIREASDSLGTVFVLCDDDFVLPDGLKRLPVSLQVSDQPIRLTIDPDDVVLWLFTGGSTGRPKRWSKTARNLLAECLVLGKQFDIRDDDIILSTVPPYHIYGLLFSVLTPLLHGARTIELHPYFPEEVRQVLVHHRATRLVSVPAHYKTMRHLNFSGNTLKSAFSSAGLLDEQDAVSFSELTGVGVHEVFGSTETGGIATRCRFHQENMWKVLPSVVAKEKDGLLAISSLFLSPELPRDCDSFFTCSDRIRFVDSDNFEHLGRADGIVKVGGKRVDVTEVEQFIRSVRSVEDAYVILTPTLDTREICLDAVYAGSIDSVSLRAELQLGLEAHALPRRLVRVDAIPSTLSGKRDLDAALVLLLKAEDSR